MIGIPLPEGCITRWRRSAEVKAADPVQRCTNMNIEEYSIDTSTWRSIIKSGRASELIDSQARACRSEGPVRAAAVGQGLAIDFRRD